MTHELASLCSDCFQRFMITSNFPLDLPTWRPTHSWLIHSQWNSGFLSEPCPPIFLISVNGNHIFPGTLGIPDASFYFKIVTESDYSLPSSLSSSCPTICHFIGSVAPHGPLSSSQYPVVCFSPTSQRILLKSKSDHVSGLSSAQIPLMAPISLRWEAKIPSIVYRSPFLLSSPHSLLVTPPSLPPHKPACWPWNYQLCCHGSLCICYFLYLQGPRLLSHVFHLPVHMLLPWRILSDHAT